MQYYSRAAPQYECVAVGSALVTPRARLAEWCREVHTGARRTSSMRSAPGMHATFPPPPCRHGVVERPQPTCVRARDARHVQSR